MADVGQRSTFHYRLFTEEEERNLELFKRLVLVQGGGKTPTDVLNTLVLRYILNNPVEFTLATCDELLQHLKDRHRINITKSTLFKYQDKKYLRKGEAWWTDQVHTVYNLELCVRIVRQRQSARKGKRV